MPNFQIVVTGKTHFRVGSAPYCGSGHESKDLRLRAVCDGTLGEKYTNGAGRKELCAFCYRSFLSACLRACFSLHGYKRAYPRARVRAGGGGWRKGCARTYSTRSHQTNTSHATGKEQTWGAHSGRSSVVPEKEGTGAYALISTLRGERIGRRRRKLRESGKPDSETGISAV